MNSSQGPVVGLLGRLSTGVSNFSIRWAHSKPRHRKPKYHLTGFKQGHGELIFVFNHIENGMIIYSHDKELKRDSKKHLDQIPITAKKLKPPIFRKDYWEPLCMIRFNKGQGEIGRSVFQKLREFRRMHELSWGWQAEDMIKMNKKNRGMTIINQKRNAIADIAAVLAGAGKGNKMWTMEPELEPEPTEAEAEELQPASEEATSEVEAGTETIATQATPAMTEPASARSTVTETKPAEEATHASTEEHAPVAAEGTTETLTEGDATATAPEAEAEAEAEAKVEPQGPQKRLLKATVYWSNDADVNWASEWSPNVDHQIGLPDDISVPRWKTRQFHPEPEPEPEEPAEEAKKNEEGEEDEGKESEGKEGEVKAEEQTQEPEMKEEPARRGFLGGLFGKKSST